MYLQVALLNLVIGAILDILTFSLNAFLIEVYLLNASSSTTNIHYKLTFIEDVPTSAWTNAEKSK